MKPEIRLQNLIDYGVKGLAEDEATNVIHDLRAAIQDIEQLLARIAELEGALEKIRDLPYEGSNNETYGGIAEQALPKCKTCGGSGVVLADKSKPYTCEACPDCEKDGVVWVDPIFHKPIAAPKKCKRCNGTGVVPQERFSGNKPCPDCPDKQ